MAFDRVEVPLIHDEPATIHNNEEARKRIFSPTKYGWPSNTPIAEMTRYDDGFTYLACACGQRRYDEYGSRAFHQDALVVAVDGALPNNGRANNLVWSAAGVYVGPNDFGQYYNGAYALVDMGATNQRAELKAGIKGLETVLEIDQQNIDRPVLRTIVIKTDSKYLFDGITDYIHRWKINDWLTLAGKRVANRDL